MVSARSKTDLKAIYTSGARPTETDFSDLIDSYTDFSELLNYISTALSTTSGILQITSASATAHGVLPESLGGTGEGSMASALTAFGFASAGAVAGFAQTGSANNFTVDQRLISSATDATEGPGIELDRRSNSPSDGDLLGFLGFKGRDSGGNKTTYSKVRGAIVSTSASNENGLMELITVVSGATAVRFNIGAGLYSENATGGDQGIDTVNVSDIYNDGEKIKNWSLLTSLDTSTGQSSENTAIPSTTSMIKLAFDEVSLNGATDDVQIEIGDSSGYATTSQGNVGSWQANTAAENAWAGSGPAEATRGNDEADLWSGIIELVKHNNNNWSVHGSLGSGTEIGTTAGFITLTDVMTRLKITPTGTPTNSFDSGSVHVWVYS